jgi:ankyrin repeat protein
MNLRLLAGIGSLALSVAAPAAPSADLIDLAFTAAAAGDVAEVKRLVESDPELVRAVGPPPWRQTILHRAADGGHAEVAAWLVEHGARIDVRDKYRDTPLHIAVDRGFVAIVELLIAHGADVNVETNKAITALDLAAGRGHDDVVSLLLDRGARVDGGSTGNHPVNSCVESGDLECVRTFIAHGASMTSPDWGPSDATSRHTNVSRVITASLPRFSPRVPSSTRGSLPDRRRFGLRPKGPPEMVSAWSKGATQLKDLTGILFSAIRSGLESLGVDVLAAGSDVNVWIPGRMGSGRGAATRRSSEESGYLRIVERLIDHGADVNRPFADGRTPLWWAAKNGHYEVVELLIARGANVNAEAKGRTALKEARKNSDAIVRLLEEHGATR